jgi:fructose-1,6-bisphosphatase II
MQNPQLAIQPTAWDLGRPRPVIPGRPATPGDRLAVMSSGVASLTLPLLAATQAAALACRPYIGRGDAKAADGAAVAALRDALARLPGRVRVVIGEGEKDDAPMLFAGEELGMTCDGPVCDLAVDPLEGTRLCAQGQEGAVSVLAAAPSGSLWATPGWYMEKLVVGAEAAGTVSLARSVSENLAAVAAALGKSVDELAVAVQDRPRHAELVAAVRRTGAAVVLFGDGDVMASLRVLLPGGDLDMLIGVGGAPEGVIMACATRALGGEMQGRLAPQSPAEEAKLAAAGVKVGHILSAEDLVSDDDCVFVATAVTGGTMLSCPEPGPGGWWTTSLLSTPDHPALIVKAFVPERPA